MIFTRISLYLHLLSLSISMFLVLSFVRVFFLFADRGMEKGVHGTGNEKIYIFSALFAVLLYIHSFWILAFVLYFDAIKDLTHSNMRIKKIYHSKIFMLTLALLGYDWKKNNNFVYRHRFFECVSSEWNWKNSHFRHLLEHRWIKTLKHEFQSFSMRIQQFTIIPRALSLSQTSISLVCANK